MSAVQLKALAKGYHTFCQRLGKPWIILIWGVTCVLLWMLVTTMLLTNPNHWLVNRFGPGILSFVTCGFQTILIGLVNYWLRHGRQEPWRPWKASPQACSNWAGTTVASGLFLSIAIPSASWLATTMAADGYARLIREASPLAITTAMMAVTTLLYPLITVIYVTQFMAGTAPAQPNATVAPDQPDTAILHGRELTRALEERRQRLPEKVQRSLMRPPLLDQEPVNEFEVRRQELLSEMERLEAEIAKLQGKEALDSIDQENLAILRWQLQMKESAFRTDGISLMLGYPRVYAGNRG